MDKSLPLDRRLLNYLPPVLREVLEFQTISGANEPEIALAWDAMTLVLANQFLEDADANGVAMWERELKIYPKDTDTLEVRKTRIKAMWNLELPYTVPWLRNWLAGLCGPTGYELTVAEYTINIQLDYNTLPDANSLATEILDMLLAVRPSNMRVLMTAFLQSYGTVGFGAFSEQSIYTEIWPHIVNALESAATLDRAACTEFSNRVELWPHIVHNLESSGGTTNAGTYEYHATVEIYPKEQEE